MGGVKEVNILKNWRGWFVVALLLSALGPYLVMGTRLEHFVIYPLFFLCLLVTINGARLNKKVLVLGVILFIAVIVILLLDQLGAGRERQVNVFASLDNLLQPFLLVFIFSFLLEEDSGSLVFKQGLIALVWSAVAMASIALVSVFLDLTDYISLFVSSGEGGEDSVWMAAEGVGRHSGIFNQPLEAGVFYSTALISLVLLHRTFQYEGTKFWLAMIFIVIGGALSLSKNFVVLGIAVALLLYLNLGRRPLLEYLYAALSMFTALCCVVFFLAGDDYRESFVGLYEQDGFIALISAGRFGGETEVQRLFGLFINEGFWSGFGLSSQATLDNGFLEYALAGGSIALALYVLFFIAGLIYSLTNFNSEGKTLLALLIFGLFASLGGPVLTANRANIGYMFLLCGCLVAAQKSQKSNT